MAATLAVEYRGSRSSLMEVGTEIGAPPSPVTRRSGCKSPCRRPLPTRIAGRGRAGVRISPEHGRQNTFRHAVVALSKGRSRSGGARPLQLPAPAVVDDIRFRLRRCLALLPVGCYDDAERFCATFMSRIARASGTRSSSDIALSTVVIASDRRVSRSRRPLLKSLATATVSAPTEVGSPVIPLARAISLTTLAHRRASSFDGKLITTPRLARPSEWGEPGPIV